MNNGSGGGGGGGSGGCSLHYQVNGAFRTDGLLAVLADDLWGAQKAKYVTTETALIRATFDYTLLDPLQFFHQASHSLPLRHLHRFIPLDHRDNYVLLLQTERTHGLRLARTPASL